VKDVERMHDHPTATRSTTKKAETAAVAPPCAMVIFGAGGDLTKRLVTPALYNLVTAKRLPDGFRLVGFDRSPGTVEEWRDNLTKMMDEFVTKGGGEFEADHIDQTAWRWLTDRMTYVHGDFTNPQDYRRLKEHLAGLDKTAGTAGNHLFYLAVPDRFFGAIVAALGTAEMVTEPDVQWRRVVIEKPFGHDLSSAKALNGEILKTLKEHQIYRMDHFLGKETVQNIMALRFANGLLSRCGIASTSTTSRSPPRRRWASNGGASSTRAPARCATWCPITCSSYCPSRPWSRRSPSMPRRFATRRRRSSRPSTR